MSLLRLLVKKKYKCTIYLSKVSFLFRLMKNSIDPEFMSFKKPVDLDLYCSTKMIYYGSEGQELTGFRF